MEWITWLKRQWLNLENMHYFCVDCTAGAQPMKRMWSNHNKYDSKSARICVSIVRLKIMMGHHSMYRFSICVSMKESSGRWCAICVSVYPLAILHWVTTYFRFSIYIIDGSIWLKWRESLYALCRRDWWDKTLTQETKSYALNECNRPAQWHQNRIDKTCTNVNKTGSYRLIETWIIRNYYYSFSVRMCYLSMW